LVPVIESDARPRIESLAGRATMLPTAAPRVPGAGGPCKPRCAPLPCRVLAPMGRELEVSTHLEEGSMSTLAVIVLVVVALLLLAMLIAGARKSAHLRSRHDLGGVDDDVTPYRSHAEASRRSDGDQL
jgi:hypothetical protein